MERNRGRERLPFREENRPQLAADNRKRLGSEGTCDQAGPRLVRLKMNSPKVFDRAFLRRVRAPVGPQRRKQGTGLAITTRHATHSGKLLRPRAPESTGTEGIRDRC